VIWRCTLIHVSLIPIAANKCAMSCSPEKTTTNHEEINRTENVLMTSETHHNYYGRCDVRVLVLIALCVDACVALMLFIGWIKVAQRKSSCLSF
jgi:hypothetical protein